MGTHLVGCLIHIKHPHSFHCCNLATAPPLSQLSTNTHTHTPLPPQRGFVYLPTATDRFNHSRHVHDGGGTVCTLLAVGHFHYVADYLCRVAHSFPNSRTYMHKPEHTQEQSMYRGGGRHTEHTRNPHERLCVCVCVMR